MGKRILIVDDDILLRHSLAEQLAKLDDFQETAEAGSGREALEMATRQPFDLILLDVGLPDLDGREVCQQLRQAGVRIPILMLTGADTDQDTVAGLESGANDYITKPFRLNVLLARLRAHLRQHEFSEQAIFTIGRFRFQPATKILLDQNRKIHLTEKEAAILKYLLRAGNRVVVRETLLHDVWGYNSNVTTHTLETHIYRLRQKIEPDPSNARLLITESGGYRLNV
ncbi:MAG: response regulator transcription factor [Alphaproteobacteria bacterium]|nr:response regulator transcription factor [Alphaproteobacteria bacterium]